MCRNSQHRKAKGAEWVSASKGSWNRLGYPKRSRITTLIHSVFTGHLLLVRHYSRDRHRKEQDDRQSLCCLKPGSIGVTDNQEAQQLNQHDNINRETPLCQSDSWAVTWWEVWRISVPDRGTASEGPMSGKDRLFQDRKVSRCLEREFMFPLQRVHGSTEHFAF